MAFGEPRDISSGVWGTCDYSSPCTLFSNPQILNALEAAARGVHDGYSGGVTTIVYGTSNYGLAANNMSDSDMYNVGYYQEMRADDLFNYQLDNGYLQQNSSARVRH